ncbi:UNVERIFIED_CONTAM: hypothetical protein H355_012458, partial [Colinus virginianus]
TSRLQRPLIFLRLCPVAFQNMLEELIIHKPEDPIQFMIDHLKEYNDDAPRICILGPPASGKTTVAIRLCKHLDAIRISQETLLSKETLAVTKEAKAYKERKQKIPNALWANLIRERLSNVDCIKQANNTFMVWFNRAGFWKASLKIRNRHGCCNHLASFRGMLVSSARFMHDCNQQLPEIKQLMRTTLFFLFLPAVVLAGVVVLYAADTTLIERDSGKRLDPLTEEVYHTTFDWPSDVQIQQRLVKPDQSEEEMSKQLLEYHRNFPGVFQIYQKVLRSINADQPCVDVISQALTYVQTRHRSAAPFTPRILFCGPPGSGKSLQAALIAQKYGVVNICCGQLLKEAVADKTKLGELVKPYIDNGYPGRAPCLIAL